jgi:hypothetical protein
LNTLFTDFVSCKSVTKVFIAFFTFAPNTKFIDTLRSNPKDTESVIKGSRYAVYNLTAIHYVLTTQTGIIVIWMFFTKASYIPLF